MLERAKIAAEMKDLDQPSRATLRKYGVRFGAYHIYVPALLKPAARALASLLWAEKQDNVDMAALSGAQHLAGSGRTSFPVDKALHRDAYRVLGYRQCGERAVRVDILERLADLIRPALSWRETSPGEKPAGAFDGRGFVVTQAMTSLTGSAGEDFASILRALGYRMERRAPLPPKPAAVEAPAAETMPAAEAAPTEAVTETSPQAASEAVAVAAAVEAVAAEVRCRRERAALTRSPMFRRCRRCRYRRRRHRSCPPSPLRLPLKPSRRLLSTPIPRRAATIEAAAIEAPQDHAAAAATAETAAAGDVAPVEAAAPAVAAPDAVAAPETGRGLAARWPVGRAPAASRSQPSSPSGPPRGRRAACRRRGRGHRSPPRTSGTGAGGASVAANSASRAPMRQRGRRGGARRRRAGSRTARGTGRPPRERFAGKGRDNDKGRDKGKFGGGATRQGRPRSRRDRAAGRAGPRTGPMRPARPRASATARSTPIRRSPSWRR